MYCIAEEILILNFEDSFLFKIKFQGTGILQKYILKVESCDLIVFTAWWVLVQIVKFVFAYGNKEASRHFTNEYWMPESSAYGSPIVLNRLIKSGEFEPNVVNSISSKKWGQSLLLGNELDELC